MKPGFNNVDMKRKMIMPKEEWSDKFRDEQVEIKLILVDGENFENRMTARSCYFDSVDDAKKAARKWGFRYQESVTKIQGFEYKDREILIAIKKWEDTKWN